MKVYKQLSHFLRCKQLVARDEVCLLGEGVHHNPDDSVALDWWQISDEVHVDCGPRL